MLASVTVWATPVWAIAQGPLAARIASVAPALEPADPIASAVVIFRAVQVQLTGTPSEAVPAGSMDPVRAATATVAFPAWDLVVAVSAVAASIVAAEAFEAVVVASVAVVVASEVAEAGAAAVVAVAADKRRES